MLRVLALFCVVLSFRAFGETPYATLETAFQNATAVPVIQSNYHGKCFTPQAQDHPYSVRPKTKTVGPDLGPAFPQDPGRLILLSYEGEKPSVDFFQFVPKPEDDGPLAEIINRKGFACDSQEFSISESWACYLPLHETKLGLYQDIRNQKTDPYGRQMWRQQMWLKQAPSLLIASIEETWSNYVSDDGKTNGDGSASYLCYFYDASIP